MIFDKNLNWNKHISSLKTHAYKTTNIIKLLVNNKLGAQNIILQNVYKALIRSKIDSGSIIYGSAKKNCFSQT